ncbi:3-phosphoserine/phosphohydroxythreonine transaminase [Burkholderia sp. JPY481]
MRRPFNFSAGPSTLPEEVLDQIADEIPDWHGSGMSVMEMSHRSRQFESILADALSDLTELLEVPDSHQILFMQGGGLGANAIVPLNLLRGRRSADYVVTGYWSSRSLDEAQRYCEARLVAIAAERNGRIHVPPACEWPVSPDAAYLHLCTNETIDGIELFDLPDSQGVPIVADVSSHILSRSVSVSAYDVLYAGAQKNVGIAGVTVYIVRKELLDRALPICPSVFEWSTLAKHNSMYNTPPTWAIYVAGLVFKWIKRHGGIPAIEKRNIEKSALLYETIDGSSLYQNRVSPAVRSRMNVPFHLTDPSLNDAFLNGAAAQGLLNLKGHRIFGGMRASLYNALPVEAVHSLVDYMRNFERQFA